MRRSSSRPGSLAALLAPEPAASPADMELVDAVQDPAARRALNLVLTAHPREARLLATTIRNLEGAATAHARMSGHAPT